MKPQTNVELRSVPASEARALLEQQRESNLSIAAFARSRGVKPWVLYNARGLAQRRAARERASQFAEFQVVDQQSDVRDDRGAIELTLPSGIVLRIRRDFDEVALRRLLGTLGAC